MEVKVGGFRNADVLKTFLQSVQQLTIGHFYLCTHICLSSMESDLEAKLRDRYTLIDKTDMEQIKEAQARGINIGDDGTLVGEPDGSGFGVGVAPSSAKAADIASISTKGGKAAKKKGKDRQRFVVVGYFRFFHVLLSVFVFKSLFSLMIIHQ